MSFFIDKNVQFWNIEHFEYNMSNNTNPFIHD